jgi:hypothetical protein
LLQQTHLRHFDGNDDENYWEQSIKVESGVHRCWLFVCVSFFCPRLVYK